jgi:hypothetical protein
VGTPTFFGKMMRIAGKSAKGGRDSDVLSIMCKFANLAAKILIISDIISKSTNFLCTFAVD